MATKALLVCFCKVLISARGIFYFIHILNYGMLLLLLLLLLQVLMGISGTSLPLVSNAGTPLLPQLLHDHLLHHRCPQTAAIIARDLLTPHQVHHATGFQTFHLLLIDL
jgi:hypothetical protein